MNRKKAALHNLGCKVNAYETEAMARLLERAGYEIVNFEEMADVYIVNTCSVTNIADRKSRQMLHRARKKNPQAVVVAAGCYAQTKTREAEQDPAADILIGNNRKHELPEILEAYWQEQKEADAHRTSAAGAVLEAGREAEDGRGVSAARAALEAGREAEDGRGVSAAGAALGAGREAEDGRGASAAGAALEMGEKRNRPVVTAVSEIGGRQEYEALGQALNAGRRAGRTRAFLKVQDGCNQFCSYCVIPYARGRARSRELADVLSEIRALAENGYQEVVLTGIHLSSYGTDCGESLLRLVQEAAKVEGIRRIRLGSLEPGIVTEEFVSALAGTGKVCPHFHLSLQSGCNATLRRMNRHYTAEEYRAGCRLLREYFSHPAITTDVIAGFPGETEEEFSATREYVEEIHFYEMHVFKYSRREGTAAASMEGQVPEQEKARRSAELISLADRMSGEFREYYVGKDVEALMEEPLEIDGRRYASGFTGEYVRVACPGGGDLSNTFVRGKVLGKLREGLYLMEAR